MGSNGRFSDGFLMGAVAGGALVFLLGTKRGNKVLKLLMEEGKVGFNELMEEIDELKSEAREMQEEVEGDEAELAAEKADEPKPNGSNGTAATAKPSRSTKRFFKKKYINSKINY